ncbi:hypothetical protein [Aquimarina litoralis]|uniref:hypothetical protein n=1 Tax=Aquimarina litoralis TaxID=584605 RepID=UPI001C575E85|nr:hypothetical protein [Aquimarina litoralis]MBW1298654.1 hypothetical protein [Aquimarina litoralis]
MKKKILITLILLMSTVIIHQIYWYRILNGNLSIWINNQSEVDLIENVEVYLDDKEIINENLKSDLLDYKSFTFKVSPGKHRLRIINKINKIDQEEVFHLILSKRTVIEFLDDFEHSDAKNKIKVNVKIRNIFGKMIIQ